MITSIVLFYYKHERNNYNVYDRKFVFETSWNYGIQKYGEVRNR